MSNYNFNEALCRQLTNGEIAVHYNSGGLDMLRALLKKCAPEDDVKTSGVFDYYYIINNLYVGTQITHLKPVPLSDFIVKDNKPFEWTDELVEEAIRKAIENATKIDANISAKLCIDDFKASKQRKSLFTTEDGKQIFEEGAEVICVEKDFNIRKAYISMFATPIQCNKYFSNEPAAREYVRLNKPMYSLNDIANVSEKLDWKFGELTKLQTELEKLKQ